jgi:acyl-CoA thioesterase FadM
LADLASADEIAQRRIVFMQTMLTDIKKAREMAPTISTDIDEQRKVIEASTRWDYIQEVSEQEQLEYNTRVRNYNDRRKVLDREILKSTIAFGYIGACVGGTIVWLVFGRRIRKSVTIPNTKRGRRR